MKFKDLFSYTQDGEMYFTKITRPLSYWIILITFIILLILNSFNIIHTEQGYVEILKQVLLTMVGFYFTARTIEKIMNKNNKVNKDKEDDLISEDLK